MRKIKYTEPSYTVDISNIETIDDISAEFAIAKFNARIPLDDNELLDIIDYVMYNAPVIYVYDVKCDCKQKQPWYKRAWNKIKSVFTR